MSTTRLLTTFASTTAPFSGGAAGDLCALADIKTELGLAVTTYDSWLSAAIARLSQEARNFCHRDFIAAWSLDRLWPQRDPWPRAISGRGKPLQLSLYPLVEPSAPVAAIAAPSAPVLTTAAGGTQPASTCFVRITYATPSGETPGSPETAAPVAANSYLSVAAPGADSAGVATGWNVYVATASGQWALQNASPLALTASWTQSGALLAATPLPAAVLVTETTSTPVALVENVDFRVDYATGEIVRLDSWGYEKDWSAVGYAVWYQSGFATVPSDVQDALLRAVVARWFTRGRDPTLRSESVPGVYAATYNAAPGGGDGPFTADVAAVLRNYRVPVFG